MLTGRLNLFKITPTMPVRLINYLNRIIFLLILVTIFALPLFFLPITSEIFDFNKNILLIFSTLMLMILWAIKMVIQGEVQIKFSTIDLPIILITIAFIASNLVIPSQNKMETFINAGSTGTIVALSLFYLIVLNNVKKEQIKLILYALITSGFVLSAFSLLQFVGIPNSLPALMKEKSFSPVGGLVSLLSILIPIGTIAITYFFNKIKSESKKLPFLLGFSSLVLLANIILTVYKLLTSNKPSILPINDGWEIAIESLKGSPFLGVGPSNFLSAFTQFKGTAFNLEDLWFNRFVLSSNWYFQLLTTVGIIGLTAFLFVVYRSIKLAYKNRSEGLPNFSIGISLFVSFVIMLILPINFCLIFLVYTLLGLLAVEHSTKSHNEKSKILPTILMLVVLALAGAGFFFFSRDWRSDYLFNKAVNAFNQNNGNLTYELQIKAITDAPYRTIYRIAYSQTNLALANSILAKKDLTDQERQNISVLIQQAIQEAKTAVTLSPKNVNVWENLANIYRSLINFAEGAENWTIAAYQQAIVLDPLNPSLRISFGQLYYSLKDWENAQRQFEIATQVKPNMANSFYNLAAALKEQGKFSQAQTAMESVISLVPKDSPDYQKAVDELEAVKKKATQQTGEQIPGSTLTKPEPAPKGINPQIPLPTDAAPEISPTPTIAPNP